MWSKLKTWVLPSVLLSELSSKITPGLHHYRRERDGQFVRYHLRVENSGQSLLLVAAAEAVRLTSSGTIAAYGILEGRSDEAILADLTSIPNGAALISEVRQLIQVLGQPSKRYPVFNLTDATGEDQPLGLIAPFQADVVLGEWDTLQLCLHALWNAGIPHVRFLCYSPQPLSEQQTDILCSAIQLAEDIGMIAGARLTAGQLLHLDSSGSKTVLDRIADLGVDYVVVPWAVSRDLHRRLFGLEDQEQLEKVIRAADRWEVTCVLEAALTRQSADVFEMELDRMRSEGIEHVEVFALAQHPDFAADGQPAENAQEDFCRPFEHQHLRQIAGWIEDLADDRRIQIIWLPTVSLRGELNGELTARLLRLGPRAGADISIRVESDGKVIPPRGPRQSVGTIHRSPWNEIWSHPCFRRFRQLVSGNERCVECSMMTVCAAFCPADPQGWAIEE
jgi:radical SAM protein with 4Fe4S-binding SPASM domain